jgi:hypothetical protein
MSAKPSITIPAFAGARTAAGGIAVGSLGTLVFALLARDWNVAIAVGTTIAPGALVYLVANGGLKGVILALWRGAPSPRRRRAAGRTTGRAAA